MPELSFFSEEQQPLPREKVALESVALEPYPDGRRVRVSMHITPFGPDDRPNLHISVRNPEDVEVATMNVVEALERKIELTVHLRGTEINDGIYPVIVELFYNPAEIQDSITETFTLP